MNERGREMHGKGDSGGGESEKGWEPEKEKVCKRDDRCLRTFFSRAFLYLLLSATGLPSSSSLPAIRKSVLLDTAVVTYCRWQ